MSAQDTVTLVAGVLCAALGLWARRHRSRTDLGLGVPGGPGDVGRGLLFGLVALAVLWAAFVLTGLGRPGTGGALLPAAGITVYFAVLFLVEEVAFRGWGTSGLALLVGVWPATVVVSVVVGAAYAFNPAATPLAVVGAIVFNVVIGATRVRTGRIWFGWGMRITWNAGMVALGFGDSDYRLTHPVARLFLDGADWLTGGRFGPESGLVGILVMVAMLAVVVRWVPATHGPWRVERHPADTRARVTT